MVDLNIVEQILGNSPYPIALIAENLNLIYLNSVMEEYLSINNSEKILNKPITELFIEEDGEIFEQFVKHSVNSELIHQWNSFQLKSSDNRKQNVILITSESLPIFEGSDIYLVTGLPILPDQLDETLTEIIRQNGNDRYSDQRFEHYFDNAIVGIAIVDDNGIVEDVNSTLVKQIGRSKGELVNYHFEKVLNSSTKKSLNNLFNRIRKSKNTYLKDVVTVQQEEGYNKIFEISVARFEYEKPEQEKFMILSEDITNQQETHSALIQSEKLALTGRLAASLAHEINNPLQTSIGCLGLVEEMLDDKDQEIGVYIKMAMEELQRSARIVKKLRDLNRKADSSDKSPVNIRKIIEGVLLLTKNRLYDRNIIPIFPYIGPSPVMNVSSDQIQQVILNLVMNAIDALPQGGNIYLDLIPTDDPEGLNIKVRDTGMGITPDVMQHLFDPFFTTKEDGLGLGLYNCKQIIDDHNGTFNVESEPGKGTVFTIWIPGPQFSADEE